MQELREIISQNLSRHPELDYYLPLIEKVSRNSITHPDICIETCKSLLEGISKTIIQNLTTDNELDKKKINKLDISVLIKKCMKLLSENDDEFEVDLSRASASLAYSLGSLRNARGDISHGKSAPKEFQSTVIFAKSIVKITDGLLVYMILSYFKKREIVQEQIEYDDNYSFNEYLDDAYPLEGKPLYSRALYDQYYEDYQIQLEEFIDQSSEDEE